MVQRVFEEREATQQDTTTQLKRQQRKDAGGFEEMTKI